MHMAYSGFPETTREACGGPAPRIPWQRADSRTRAEITIYICIYANVTIYGIGRITRGEEAKHVATTEQSERQTGRALSQMRVADAARRAFRG